MVQLGQLEEIYPQQEVQQGSGIQTAALYLVEKLNQITIEYNGTSWTVVQL
jgi:hypothetical protein